jgi:uncharacterized lipoprotein NlpE involved in copper resistance
MKIKSGIPIICYLAIILTLVNCDLRSDREESSLKEERIQACMKLSRARLMQDPVIFI